MSATHGVNVRRITTICVILPAVFILARCNKDSEKRSLNNYVATSVPYTVQSHNIHHDDLSLASSLSEKADNFGSHDNTAQEIPDCVNENHCINNASVEGTFRPYSQDELNKILQNYEADKEQMEAQETTKKFANYYSVANSNNIETSSSAGDPDKSKAWNLISYHQTHQPIQHSHNSYSSNNNNPNNNNNNKNPYDDRMGWVTLEPVAWSSSQVQKWEPNTKPSWPIPSSSNGPWGSPSQYQQQSNYGGYSDRPYKKPTYQYQSKPWNSKPQFSDFGGNQEIITDGQPGYFPNDRPSSSTQGSYKPWLEHTQTLSYIDSGNRPATHVLYQGIGTGSPPHHIPPERPAPQPSSSDGDGHWVLLSSTKGYSVPHRQRSFGRSLDVEKEAASVKPAGQEVKPERPLSARRSIRLTVLPSLNGAGSTVTSHNGMIEVESTDQTVDEAHREHLARMMRFENATQKEGHTIRSNSYHGIPAKVEAVARPAERRSTLLGAVSAGMIPATMAMLLPMLLGRRKRSLEPQILTLSIRDYGQPGTDVTGYHKKDLPKRKIMY